MMKKKKIYLKILVIVFGLGLLFYYPYQTKRSSQMDLGWIKTDLGFYHIYYDFKYSESDFINNLYSYLHQTSMDVDVTNYVFKKSSRSEKLLVYKKGFINIKVGEIPYYGEGSVDFRCSDYYILRTKGFYSNNFLNPDFNPHKLDVFFEDNYPDFQLFDTTQEQEEMALIKYSKNKSEVNCSKGIEETELENLCKDLTLFIEQNNFDFNYALIPIQRSK